MHPTGCMPPTAYLQVIPMLWKTGTMQREDAAAAVSVHPTAGACSRRFATMAQCFEFFLEPIWKLQREFIQVKGHAVIG